MNALTLDVLPDGTVQGLYTEAIDLTLVGQLRIARASTIEFDNPAQLWRVFDRRGRCIHSAVSRTECLEWEQEFFAPEGGV
jgi:hypothetical protein